MLIKKKLQFKKIASYHDEIIRKCFSPDWSSNKVEYGAAKVNWSLTFISLSGMVTKLECFNLMGKEWLGNDYAIMNSGCFWKPQTFYK